MQKKIKVALMSYAMDNRKGMGTAIYTRRLIEEMISDERYEWYLVHFDEVDDPLYKKAHEIIMPDVTLPFATRFVRTMLFFWKYRKEKFDIIHWFQPRLYPFFWFAPAWHIVVTAHGAGDITAPGSFPFSRRVFNFVMIHFNRYLSAVIAVSEFGKREIEQWYKVSPEKVFVTYPGGGERFRPLSRIGAMEKVNALYGITAPFILDVSRLEPHKNVHRLVEAYIIARDKGVLHTLVVVGKNSEDQDHVRTFARESDYGGDILFIAHAEGDALNALYAAADVFVFPSLNEGFGLPLVEAMSVGTPIIASNVTALPEIIGSAGVCVDPLDVKRIADEICGLLSDPDKRKTFAAEGLKRSSKFLWSRTAQETVMLYEKILRRVQ